MLSLSPDSNGNLIFFLSFSPDSSDEKRDAVKLAACFHTCGVVPAAFPAPISPCDLGLICSNFLFSFRLLYFFWDSVQFLQPKLISYLVSRSYTSAHSSRDTSLVFLVQPLKMMPAALPLGHTAARPEILDLGLVAGGESSSSAVADAAARRWMTEVRYRARIRRPNLMDESRKDFLVSIK